MALKVDEAARAIALRRFALPECLHVPVAAISQEAILSHIGDIRSVLSAGVPNKALLVEAGDLAPRDDRLPIWQLSESAVLSRKSQVWVHVEFTRYREAYARAFPEEPLDGRIISHSMNRRLARAQGFQYIRVVPISRRANSSSALSESWGVTHHLRSQSTPALRRGNASIRYADLTDLMVMMDLMVGGGVMDAVNQAQALVSVAPAVPST
ncbi:MAG: hypothetical protein H6843_09705 [Rhodospirillaceae bacterium]|nr:hypothetical protein [Rhodospirillaceae bacterium]